MPTPGKQWRHVIINTRSSWHHGDARGFRMRDHRIHSSGDYLHPPADGEHLGLLTRRIETSGPQIQFSERLYPIVGRALVECLTQAGHTVLATAVARLHAHLLIELPDNILKMRAIVGQAKCAASGAVKRELPGAVWARGGLFKRITSRAHQQSAYEYILYRQGPRVWTWSFRDSSDAGMIGRVRG